MTIAELLAKRQETYTAAQKLLADNQVLTTEQLVQHKAYITQIDAIDATIEAHKANEAQMAKSAQPVQGQQNAPAPVPATVKGDVPALGGYVRSLYNARGNPIVAAEWALKNYGEQHPTTKALNTAVAASGGDMVPEDFANQVIELLRPNTVVRASGATVIPMPRGTMRMGKQTAGVTGSYGAEGSSSATQKPGTGNIIASFKKLTVKVPVSNDWLRYASPATDGLVQNDIVLGLARTEDLGFLRGDGTADWPRGARFIAPASGLIQSNQANTLESVDSDLSNAKLALRRANVPMLKPTWFFPPDIEEFLLKLKNANGFYVYKEEMTSRGTVNGIKYATTTQIPINLGVGGNATEIYLVDAAQLMIFDSLTLSLAMSQDASYTAEDGTVRNAFDRDETLFRAITEHDFHARHDEAVAVITGVTWKP